MQVCSLLLNFSKFGANFSIYTYTHKKTALTRKQFLIIILLTRASHQLPLQPGQHTFHIRQQLELRP